MNRYYAQDGPPADAAPLLSHDAPFLFRVIDLFPVPIELFLPNGVSAFVNSAFLECLGIPDPSEIVGKLNILKDPYINRDAELAEHIRQMFAGEILTCFDVKVPFREISRRYRGEAGNGAGGMSQDITGFPIWDESGRAAYIGILFKTRRVYQEQYDVSKAKTLIEQRWLKEFDMHSVAGSLGLSPHYFARLFKKHTGMTPYSYYQNIKIERLKEALRDKSLSIAQAFASCGADYYGSLAKAFKDSTGMTPSGYRKACPENPPAEQSVPPPRPAVPPDRFHLPPLRLSGGDETRFFQMTELFPIPIQVFNPGGDLIYLNEAVLRMWNVADSSQILGKYNLIRDPFVNDRFGMKAHVKRMFDGEIVLIPDIKLPLENFWAWYRKRSPACEIEAIYTDILNFPVFAADGKMSHMISVFFTSRIYQGKSYAAQAKEYMENHWMEDFDPDKISKAVGLSRYHFTRLFKKYTGITPYSYYQELKVNKLRDALRDHNLTVSEAFAACGLTYHSNYARLFREKTGMTPSEYRKTTE